MSNQSNITSGSADSRKTVVHSSEHGGEVRVGLYGDEWQSKVRALAIRVLSSQPNPKETPRHDLAEFVAVVHPEKVASFLKVGSEGRKWSTYEVSVIWHGGRGIAGDGRDIDSCAAPRGSFATHLQIWDVDNQRHVHAFRCGSSMAWAEARYSELARKGRRVWLPESGTWGATTQPAAKAA